MSEPSRVFAEWASPYRDRGFWPRPISRRPVRISEILAAMNAGDPA
jgi:hypothetical protein